MDIINGIIAHWEIISTLISVAVVGALLYLQKIFVRKIECKECRDDLENRLDSLKAAQAEYGESRAVVSQQLAAMPKATDVQDLKVVIERLSGDIRTVQAEIKGQGEMLKAVKSQGDRMNSYLL
ncbi:MAG: DUF2730 domain-containing protein, partial [Desulfovibrio sp.]|nr:DUF2730 domain-containing protein [Desulfovibrio sp.]